MDSSTTTSFFMTLAARRNGFYCLFVSASEVLTIF
jgi:hypothetical protein